MTPSTTPCSGPAQHGRNGNTGGLEIRSPLEGVRRLLPNHYLDLANHHVHRFWPSEEARVSTASSAAESCTALLRGVVDASRAPLQNVGVCDCLRDWIAASCWRRPATVPLVFHS